MFSDPRQWEEGVLSITPGKRLAVRLFTVLLLECVHIFEYQFLGNHIFASLRPVTSFQNPSPLDRLAALQLLNSHCKSLRWRIGSMFAGRLHIWRNKLPCAGPDSKLSAPLCVPLPLNMFVEDFSSAVFLLFLSKACSFSGVWWQGSAGWSVSGSEHVVVFSFVMPWV